MSWARSDHRNSIDYGNWSPRGAARNRVQPALVLVASPDPVDGLQAALTAMINPDGHHVTLTHSEASGNQIVAQLVELVSRVRRRANSVAVTVQPVTRQGTHPRGVPRRTGEDLFHRSDALNAPSPLRDPFSVRIAATQFSR